MRTGLDPGIQAGLPSPCLFLDFRLDRGATTSRARSLAFSFAPDRLAHVESGFEIVAVEVDQKCTVKRRATDTGGAIVSRSATKAGAMEADNRFSRWGREA
jgi:hypothetical protein